jgi:hypothetical protein
MTLSTTALKAQVTFSAGNQPRFGALRPSEEKKIFNILPPEVRVMELVNRYEELSRLPVGFETPKQRTAREGQQKIVEQQLLGDIQNPGFTKEHATALMLELYKNRDSLQQELPEAIFNAIFKKATAPGKPAPQDTEDPVPAPIRRRMGAQDAKTILVPKSADLQALLAAAAEGKIGRG